MQKAIRFYCCNIMGWGNPIGIPRHETVSFEYWLSHPGQAWPEDIKIWGDYLDTTSFDWQNPDEWETPMQKAQEQASHQGLDNAPVIENLVIGSQAQETAQKIEEHPVKHITTLFQAILNQNVSTLQKLLPTGELNRPFAGTGNTPLHVAVLNGYTDIVRLLLTQPGIDTTRTNNEEKTALDLAREKGFIEIIQLLENKHD
ncbi:MAG: ankyrin repeat domain-containing protein [Elusimicrobiaceae bacterium]|nr:ankyrin repeat domain-containing protein [Elusimicrobiaceae bacterium]